jgi:hypothetical protein
MDRETIVRLYAIALKQTTELENGCCIFNKRETQQQYNVPYKSGKISAHKIIYLFHHPEFVFINTHQKVYLDCGNPACVAIEHMHYDDPNSKGAVLRRISRGAIQDGECTIANVTVHRKGNGQVSLNGKSCALHRVVFWIYSDYEKIEDLPTFLGDNMMVRHRCRTMLCLNKDHYELGSAADNVADKSRDGTRTAGERHGHAKITEVLAQAIADSWRPRGSSERMSRPERAALFGVGVQTVAHIDSRRSWDTIIHPNGKMPLKQKKRKIDKKLTEIIDWEAVNAKITANKIIKADIPKIFAGEDCWTWRQKTISQPSMSMNWRTRPVHIWAAEFTEKRVAKPGEQARHLCGYGRCINPAHLKLGTALENARDKRTHGTAGKKIDWAKAQKIRASDRAAKDLAAEYGVATSVVYGIRNNKIWRA